MTKRETDRLDAIRWRAMLEFLRIESRRVDTLNIGDGRTLRMVRSADGAVTIEARGESK